MGLKLPEDLDIGTLTSWNYSSSGNLSGGEFFKCKYWDSTNSVWSEDGINQTATTIDFVANTVHCEASHMSAFTLVVEKEPPTEIIVISPVQASDDDDDDWSYLKNANPLYISLGIIVLMGILVATGIVRD